MKLNKQINKWLLKPLRWVVWDFIGLHAIFRMLKPHPKVTTDAPTYKPPVTIGIWIISIYFACLGFSTARYERILDRAEFKYGTLMTQLSAGMPFDVNRIAEVGEFKIPLEPKFELRNYNFIVSVWHSLFSDKTPYRTRHKRIFYNEAFEIVTEKIETKNDFLLMMIELWKNKLAGVMLTETNFEGLNLLDANFEGALLQEAKFGGVTTLARANFKNADLGGADLGGVVLIKANFAGANLAGAILIRANLEGANLEGANLQRTDLRWADLRNANLAGTDFTLTKLGEVNLEGANFRGANLKDLSGTQLGSNWEEVIKHLSKVATLYNAKLNSEMEKEMKEKYPELFERPE